MEEYDKKSRCGFVVVKLELMGGTFYLMRHDERWKDLNFIGGHEKPSDGGNLLTAARRELLEEVPPLRGENGFDLEPLTDEIVYGPIKSRSTGKRVLYELRFCRLVFNKAPNNVLRAITHRSANKFVQQDNLLFSRGCRPSGLVHFLDRSINGGLCSVVPSWPEKLRRIGVADAQLEIPFQWSGHSSAEETGRNHRCPPEGSS